MIKKEFLKGVIKPLILKVLDSKDKMYGYEITQEIEKMTDGKIKLSYGGLYPILHSLEAEGILVAETTIVGSRARKYYTFSGKNKDKAIEKIQELEEFISTIQLVLNTKIANS